MKCTHCKNNPVSPAEITATTDRWCTQCLILGCTESVRWRYKGSYWDRQHMALTKYLQEHPEEALEE